MYTTRRIADNGWEKLAELGPTLSCRKLTNSVLSNKWKEWTHTVEKSVPELFISLFVLYIVTRNVKHFLHFCHGSNWVERQRIARLVFHTRNTSHLRFNKEILEESKLKPVKSSCFNLSVFHDLCREWRRCRLMDCQVTSILFILTAIRACFNLISH